MKKVLFILMLASTGSVFAAESFKGVETVNGKKVKYRNNDKVAVIGNDDERYSGDCYHDGQHYGVIKGNSTCPGILAVFPDAEHTGHISTKPATTGLKNVIGPPPPVVKMIVQGSAECQEITNLHDPWR